MDLEQGAVEAVAIDIGVAQYQIDKREEGAYVMLAGDDNKLASEQYAVGFKKEMKSFAIQFRIHLMRW